MKSINVAEQYIDKKVLNTILINNKYSKKLTTLPDFFRLSTARLLHDYVHVRVYRILVDHRFFVRIKKRIEPGKESNTRETSIFCESH